MALTAPSPTGMACPTCQCNISESAILANNPPFLPICLMRFTAGAQKDIRRITIPEHLTLDMGNYSLMGVLLHVGESRTTGHYTVYTRWRGVWHYFDDAAPVQYVAPNLSNPQIYMVLYGATDTVADGSTGPSPSSTQSTSAAVPEVEDRARVDTYARKPRDQAARKAAQCAPHKHGTGTPTRQSATSASPRKRRRTTTPADCPPIPPMSPPAHDTVDDQNAARPTSSPPTSPPMAPPTAHIIPAGTILSDDLEVDHWSTVLGDAKKNGPVEYARNIAFALLDLEPSATAKQRCTKYLIFSTKVHPDKVGGDSNRFQRLLMAYELIK